MKSTILTRVLSQTKLEQQERNQSSLSLAVHLFIEQQLKMASPVPVASYGNNSTVAQEVRSQLLPEYDGAHSSLPPLPPLC